jgi:uncharacterized OB-fold protein
MATGFLGDKSLPVEDADTAEFWAALRRDEFVLQYCPSCGRWQFPPRTSCHQCGAAVEWRPASGDATLYSFTVVHRGPADFAASVPYAVGLLDLAEGVRLVTIVDVPADEIAIGMPLSITFDHRGGDAVFLKAIVPNGGR